MEHKELLEQFTFKNGVKIKNRVVMAPMTTWSSNDDYTISDEEVTYYKKRVNGVGMVITGCTQVLENGIGFTNEFAGYSDKFTDSLRKLADAAKSGGAPAVLQIFHAGNKALPQLIKNGEVVSASAIKTPKTAFTESLVPKELSEEEIKEVIHAFGETTRRAIEAGFDGVEIHGAHGFLIQNFLSPYYNKREDKWGGSLENRMRFGLALVDEVKSIIKKYSKKPFILGYRISLEESQEGGLRIDDSYEYIDELIKKDIDYLHISLDKALESKPVESKDNQTYLELTVKKINNRVPLIAAGSLVTPEEVSKALEKGLTLAAIGHTLIMNPDWVEKVEENKTSEIKKALNPSEVKELKIPEKLWTVIKNSGNWFNIEE